MERSALLSLSIANSAQNSGRRQSWHDPPSKLSSSRNGIENIPQSKTKRNSKIFDEYAYDYFVSVRMEAHDRWAAEMSEV
jgi:hypothetical protein